MVRAACVSITLPSSTGKGTAPAGEDSTVMRIVVTGGAGFIGSHIVDAFIAAGHDVVALDNLWSHGGGRREHLNPRASFVHMDIRDEAVKRIFVDFKPEVVCHHAAQHSVAISSRDPQYDANVNVIGTLNVLDAAVACGARKVIFASSAATYGDDVTMPADESSPQFPISPYGITKMVAEHYLRFYQSEHGLEYTVFRYGNVYGPRQDPSGEAGVIAIFIGKFLAGEGIRIDWDGEQTRDYVYVRDVVNANVAALTRGTNDIFVIGTGKKTSVNQIYRSLVEVSGREAPVTRAPRRAGDAREIYFNPAKAAAELGWRADVDLVAGMRETYAYFRDRVTVGA
jgi:UDP-glucose 4-epimerase